MVAQGVLTSSGNQHICNEARKKKKKEQDYLVCDDLNLRRV